MTISSKKHASAIIAAAVLATSGIASAAVYTGPTNTGAVNTPQQWNLDGNWSTPFPNAVDAVAQLTKDIPGTISQSITLNTDITVGQLDISNASGTLSGTSGVAYNITPGSPAGTLTFQTTSGNAQLNVGTTAWPLAASVPVHAISAPIILNSPLTIKLFPQPVPASSSTTVQSLTLTGAITTNNNDVTVTGGFLNAGSLAVNADITGNGTLTFNGASTTIFSGNKTFGGKVVVNNFATGSNTGTLTLTGSSIAGASELVINGAHNGTAEIGGIVWIGTGSTLAVPTAQRLPTSKVTFNGGYLNDGAVPLVAGNTGVLQTDVVANLDFKSGSSYLNQGSSTTTAGNTLNVTNLTREQGAGVFYRYTVNATAPTKFTADKFNNVSTPASLFVGQNTPGTTSAGIVPWMVASTNVSNLGVTEFATYDSNGFRVLTSGTEYVATVSTTAGLVANANNQVVNSGGLNGLTADFSLNSLVYTSTGIVSLDSADNGGRKLTIQSGGLIFTGSAGAIGAPGGAQAGGTGAASGSRAGSIDFNGKEAVIWNTVTNTNGIGAVITNANGLTKLGTGRLILTGLNSITGETNVAGGALQVGNGTYSSKVGSGNVHVHAGATLDIQSAGAGLNSVIDVIADSATLDIQQAGILNGLTNVSGGIDTVAGLNLGSAAQGAGYYGSSAAAALYSGTLAVIANDSYFTGNGLIHVVVPEPTSLGLLAVGGAMMLRRRSRRA